MNHLTDETLRDAVARQSGNEFDSHDLFLTLMSDFGLAYIRELDACLNTNHGDPFVALHTRITRHLASEEVFGDICLQTHEKRSSENFRGKVDRCEVWRRV